jgi:hypothetical protein
MPRCDGGKDFLLSIDAVVDVEILFHVAK